MSDKVLGEVLGKKEPKTRKGRRVIRSRGPLIVEPPKTALLIRGNKSSAEVLTFLRDMHSLRFTLSNLFSRNHPDMHPFEDMERLRKLCVSYGHNLFVLGSSNKKRPFRIVFGRLFNQDVLDMAEFSVTNFKPMCSFHTRQCTQDLKPMILFQGSGFDTNVKLKTVKSLLFDFFKGKRLQRVLLKSLEHVIVCTVLENEGGTTSTDIPSILVRRYQVAYEVSASTLPRVELKEIGPRFTLTLDRIREANSETFKQALRIPKTIDPRPTKNVTKDSMAQKKGRVHLGKQVYDTIATAHHGRSKRRRLTESIKKESGTKETGGTGA